MNLTCDCCGGKMESTTDASVIVNGALDSVGDEGIIYAWEPVGRYCKTCTMLLLERIIFLIGLADVDDRDSDLDGEIAKEKEYIRAEACWEYRER